MLDRFFEEPLKIGDNNFDYQFFSIPPMPKEIGQMRLFQNAQCEGYNSTECLAQGKYIEIKQEPCSEEEKENLSDFWTPRVGEGFKAVTDTIQCSNNTDVILSSN